MRSDNQDNREGCKVLAILTPGFYEQCVGGSEHQSYLIAKAARDRGIVVHHIYVKLDNSALIHNHLNICLHPTYRPKCNHIFRCFGHTEVLCLPQAYKLLREIRPDYVYCRAGVAQAALGAWYAKHHSCKSIWQTASSYDVTPRPILSLIKSPLNWVERLLVIYAIRNSDCNVTDAEYHRQLLQSHYNRDAVVVMKGVPDANETIDKSGPVSVVWIANIKPLKQPELFIRLAEIFVDRVDVKFVMIGRPAGGEYQRTLDARIKNLPNLSYLGEKTMDEVNEILAKSHIFVNTSKYEGFPDTFIQSWMREVPVVSLLVNPDDILTSRHMGFCSGSFEQMVRDVSNLVDDEIMRIEMGRKSREYAVGHHSLKQNMKTLLDLITSE